MSGAPRFISAARRRSTLIVSIGAALLAAACSFGNDRPSPKPLEKITEPLTVRSAWNQHVGKIQFPLTVAVNAGILTLATTDGKVMAIEAETGRIVWETNVGARIAAGVGSDGSLVSVVTRDGNLIVLEQGKLKWKKPLGSRVATAPLVAGGRVFVLGVDRAVQAFDAEDGSKLWQVARPGDPLTLSQTGVIAPFGNTLLVGQGPRLAGIDPVAAQVRWEVPIGSPRGANEVERLADLIGPPMRAGIWSARAAFRPRSAASTPGAALQAGRRPSAAPKRSPATPRCSSPPTPPTVSAPGRPPAAMSSGPPKR